MINQKRIDEFYNDFEPKWKERIDSVIDHIVKGKQEHQKIAVVTGSGPNIHEGVTTLIAELINKNIIDGGVLTSSAVIAHEMGGSLDKVKRVQVDPDTFDFGDMTGKVWLPKGEIFEITELSKDEIVTIASHTKNHYALNKLVEEDIINEVLSANTRIESKIKKKVTHFSYPFGSKNEIGYREFDLLKKMDFKTVTTTRNGNIYREHKNHLECLPRIMLTNNFRIKHIGNIRRKKLVTT